MGRERRPILDYLRAGERPRRTPVEWLDWVGLVLVIISVVIVGEALITAVLGWVFSRK